MLHYISKGNLKKQDRMGVKTVGWVACGYFAFMPGTDNCESTTDKKKVVCKNCKKTAEYQTEGRVMRVRRGKKWE